MTDFYFLNKDKNVMCSFISLLQCMCKIHNLCCDGHIMYPMLVVFKYKIAKFEIWKKFEII